MDNASYMVLNTAEMGKLEIIIDRMIAARDTKTFTYKTKNGGVVTFTPPQKESTND